MEFPRKTIHSRTKSRAPPARPYYPTTDSSDRQSRKSYITKVWIDRSKAH